MNVQLSFMEVTWNVIVQQSAEAGKIIQLSSIKLGSKKFAKNIKLHHSHCFLLFQKIKLGFYLKIYQRVMGLLLQVKFMIKYFNSFLF